MLKIENLQQLQHVMKLINKYKINKLQIGDVVLESSSPAPKTYNKSQAVSEAEQSLVDLDADLFYHEKL